MTVPSGDRRWVIYQVGLWPAVAGGAVLGSYLRQWAPPAEGVAITVVSVTACVAFAYAVAWAVLAAVDTSRRRRRLPQTERFAVADVVHPQGRHRRPEVTS